MSQDIVSEVVSAASAGFVAPWRAVTSRKDCRGTSGGSYGDVAIFDDVAVKRWDAADCGYEAWLRFVLADDGEQSYSPNLPKIIWHSFELRMVILEKLQPTAGIDLPGEIYPMPLSSCWYVPVRLAQCPQWMQDLYPKLVELEDDSDGTIRIDAHGANWMQRADGTKVVTDPLAPVFCAMLSRRAYA